MIVQVVVDDETTNDIVGVGDVDFGTKEVLIDYLRSAEVVYLTRKLSSVVIYVENTYNNTDVRMHLACNI